MKNEFYLRDTRGNTGSSCMFWAKGGCGYTTSLSKAEVFSHEDAQKHADRGRHFVPLDKAKVDAVSTFRVDMQRLNLNVDFSDGLIIHRCVGSYDGNDIYFDNGEGGYTANYNEAKVYTVSEIIEGLNDKSGCALSKSFLDSICRNTLQAKNVNMRKMVTASGIRYRSPRQRPATMGKTRGNCPECGKITWDYNPYDNAYCRDHSPIY